MLRQKDLADVLSVAQTTIANYEQGTRFPDEDTLSRLADFFGVTMDFLLGRDEPGGIRTRPESPDTVTDAVRGYVSALLSGRPGGAEEIIERYSADHPALADIYLGLLQPAMRLTGEMWETGVIDVWQEHMISEFTLSLMAKLCGERIAGETAGVFVGFSVSGERHVIGIRMITDLLAANGWKTFFLGTDLPAESVVGVLESTSAGVIGISATLPSHVNSVEILIRAIRSKRTLRRVRVMVGGLAFAGQPGLWERIGADGYARDAAEAVEVAAKLAGTVP